MNEIKLTQINVEYTLPTIKADLESLKQEVNRVAESYAGWIVNEEEIDVAKKTTALLNKVAKELSDKRIALAKEIKKPLDEFESEIKTLTKRLETVSGDIKAQVDTFTEQQKQSKREAILALEEWADYMLFDDRWLNKGVSLPEIKESLLAQRKVFENSCLMIQTTCNALGLEAEKYYGQLANKLPIQSIIAQIQNDSEVKQRYANAPKVEEQPKVEVKIEDVQDTNTYTFRLEVSGTKLQLKALREFIDNNGLKYTKL